jgi:hypothetical protein
VETAAHLLITIHQQLKRKILDSGYVQVDETLTKLIDPDCRGRITRCLLVGLSRPAGKRDRVGVLALAQR